MRKPWRWNHRSDVMKPVRILVTLALLLCATRLDAQQYFGMNQVQYKHFKWQVIET